MEIDPRHLRLLRAIAEQGSFTRAAATQRISQPAMSAGIAQLEKRLGVRVLERGRHGARLNDFGRLLLVRSSMHYAVEEAGRYAMVYTTATKSAIETYAKSRVIGIDPTTLAITATIDSPSSGYVTITSDYTFNFMFQSMLPSSIGSVPMHAQAEVPRTN